MVILLFGFFDFIGALQIILCKPQLQDLKPCCIETKKALIKTMQECRNVRY